MRWLNIMCCCFHQILNSFHTSMSDKVDLLLRWIHFWDAIWFEGWWVRIHQHFFDTCGRLVFGTLGPYRFSCGLHTLGNVSRRCDGTSTQLILVRLSQSAVKALSFCDSLGIGNRDSAVVRLLERLWVSALNSTFKILAGATGDRV